jgi:hypothetical protein
VIHHDNSHDQRRSELRSLGRRDVLRIGGFSVATAAVISACGEHVRGDVGRVGAVPTTVKLPDAIVNNIVLLRTASSMEHSTIDVYNQVIGKSDLLDPKYDDVATRFMDDHKAHAALLEKLTTAAGGTPWACGNPKFDDVVVVPVLQRITVGVPATSSSAAIPPSDDPHRDILNFLHGLEALSGATYQAFVAQFTEPSLRSDAMSMGARESRHAALLAMTINPSRPGGLVNFNDAVNAQPGSAPTTVAPTTTIQNIATPGGGVAPTPEAPQTEIPTVTAIPSQFGSLAPIQIVVGAGDENGTRLKVNMETPSFNSYIYEYMKPTC